MKPALCHISALSKVIIFRLVSCALLLAKISLRSENSHSQFTQPIHTASSHSQFTQQVTQPIRTGNSHSQFTQPIHTASHTTIRTASSHSNSHSQFTQAIHTASSPSQFTLGSHNSHCGHTIHTAVDATLLNGNVHVFSRLSEIWEFQEHTK